MSKSKTSILLVDDHSVVIEGIKSALRQHLEFDVVGEALDGLQAVELAKSLKPEILILDISMPGLNGVEAAKKIKRISPDTKIIVYTMHSDKGFVIDLFKAGISAYVLKEDPLSDLILSIKAVSGGGTYFSTMAPTVLLRHVKDLEERTNTEDQFENLSRREQEVFKHLAEGLSIKDIAEKLFISPKTVESHKYNIMEKLKADSVVDLTKLAIKKNLIKI